MVIFRNELLVTLLIEDGLIGVVVERREQQADLMIRRDVVQDLSHISMAMTGPYLTLM